LNNRYRVDFIKQKKAEVLIDDIPDNDVALGVEQNLIDLFGGAGKSPGNPTGNRIPATTDASRIKKGQEFLDKNYKNWRKKDFTRTGAASQTP
jgi:hypothetical protein